MNLIPVQYRILAAVVFAALVISGSAAAYFSWQNHQRQIGEDRATVTYDKKIKVQKEEAAALLKKETEAVEATQKRLQESKDNQEVQDAINKKTVDVLSGRVRALGGIIGRLRDPNAGRGDGDSVPQGGTPTDASNSVYNRAEAAGLLSIQLSGLLRAKSCEADEINTAYISCRADAFSVRVITGSGSK